MASKVSSSTDFLILDVFSFCSCGIIELAEVVAFCVIERKSKEILMLKISLRELEMLVNLSYIQPCTFPIKISCQRIEVNQ